jgi:hypothetical protein
VIGRNISAAVTACQAWLVLNFNKFKALKDALHKHPYIPTMRQVKRVIFLLKNFLKFRIARTDEL